MKVAVLGKWPKETLSGGVAVHTVSLVKELSQLKGLKIHMVSFGEDSKILNENNLEINLIKNRRIYYILPFLALIRLWIEIKKINPDILHLQGSNISPYLFYTLLMAGNKKKVVTYHSYPSRELVAHGHLKVKTFKYKFLRFIEKYTAKKMDYNITVDTRLKKWLVEEFGKQMGSKIDVILNGVNINLFDFKIDKFKNKSKHGLPKENPVIFHAKAFVPKNGQEYLIRAMPSILKEIPDVKLVLAGEGPLKGEMIELIHQLDIMDNIRFDGDIPNKNIPEYMAATDLMVIPSIHINNLEEASSILLVEAMAMKKPVIASEIGGLKESITAGVNGLLVPDKDPEAIAKCACDVLNNPVLATKMGDNAFNYVKKERTWSKIALETYNVYRKMLN